MDEPIDLVEKIKLGDKKSEQHLVSYYWRKLYFILNKRAGDPDLAADLTQETLIVVINKARNGEIRNPSALAAFIRQVGINLLLAEYRRNDSRKTETSTDLEEIFDATKDELFSKLSHQMLGQQVVQLMHELPMARDRDLLLRHFVHGQSKADICQELKFTPDNFDRILNRARNRLKQILLLKTGIDLKSQSISHLLSIALISSALAQMPYQLFTNNEQEMRETYQLEHLVKVERELSSYFSPKVIHQQQDTTQEV